MNHSERLQIWKSTSIWDFSEYYGIFNIKMIVWIWSLWEQARIILFAVLYLLLTPRIGMIYGPYINVGFGMKAAHFKLLYRILTFFDSMANDLSCRHLRVRDPLLLLLCSTGYDGSIFSGISENQCRICTFHVSFISMWYTPFMIIFQSPFRR